MAVSNGANSTNEAPKMAGELFTVPVKLDNRDYFFNIKENRKKDVFLQIVESKRAFSDPKVQDTSAHRTQIAIFESDMQEFLQGLNTALSFIEKNRKTRQKLRAEKDARYSKKGPATPRAKTKDLSPVPKKTLRIHVVSKLPKAQSQSNEVADETKEESAQESVK